MKTLAGLATYVATVVLLVFGVAAGGAYLLQPDVTAKAEAKPRQIPQKILDSIERKKPIVMDVPAPARLERPVVKIPDVALVEKAAPRQIIREVSLPVPERPSRKRVARKSTPPNGPQITPVTTTPVPVVVGRTDFPY